ncbi:MAG: thioredoxin family protein [Desulfobacterales bacterium]|nr:thioredoxin family protein [Desulfobacterales bacterium]
MIRGDRWKQRIQWEKNDRDTDDPNATDASDDPDDPDDPDDRNGKDGLTIRQRKGEGARMKRDKGKWKEKRRGALPVLLILIGLAVLFSVNHAAAAGIRWRSFNDGMALGKNEGKKIYINFYSNNCRYCLDMQMKTFKDPSVISFLNEFFIPIRVNSDREREISRNFRVRGLPDNWFMMADGKVIGRRPGYISPDDFFQILKQVNTAGVD